MAREKGLSPHLGGETLFHKVFELVAHKYPHRTAVVDNTVQVKTEVDLTSIDPIRYKYFEINERANRFAHWLTFQKLPAETPIAIFYGRGVSLIISILACMKAGLPFVLLTPNKERVGATAGILESCEPGVILADKKLLEEHEEQFEAVADIITLDIRDDSNEHTREINECSRENPNIDIKPEQLSYIAYTSGTTSKQDGVELTYSGLVYVMDGILSCFGVNSDTVNRFACFADPSFDAMLQEMVCAFGCGGELCVVPEKCKTDNALLNTFLRTRHVEHITLPPEKVYALDIEDLELKTIISTGSQLPPKLAARLRARGILYNGYGDVEDGVGGTVVKVDSDTVYIDDGFVGHNYWVFNTDESIEPGTLSLNYDEEDGGELYVSGCCLARGYKDNPEKTAQRFFYVEEPSEDPAGHDKLLEVRHDIDSTEPEVQRDGKKFIRVFRTRNRAIRLDGNKYQLQGRLDDLYKYYGKRIALDEVRDAIQRILDPEFVMFLPAIARDGFSYRPVFIKARPGQDLQLNQALAEQLRREGLPVMPSHWYILQELPEKKAAGKVNRHALRRYAESKPAQFIRPEVTASLVGGYEKEMAELWKKHLPLPEEFELSLDDGFNLLGGDSIRLVNLVTELRNKYSLGLPLYEMFDETYRRGEALSLRYMARVIRRHLSETTPLIEFAIGNAGYAYSQSSRRPTLYLVHDVLGTVPADLSRLGNLVAKKGNVRSAKLHSRALVDIYDADYSIPDMASDYLSTVLFDSARRAGDAPVLFMGWSFGAVVAFEMLRQALEQGRNAYAVLIDPKIISADVSDLTEQLVELFTNSKTTIAKNIVSLDKQRLGTALSGLSLTKQMEKLVTLGMNKIKSMSCDAEAKIARAKALRALCVNIEAGLRYDFSNEMPDELKGNVKVYVTSTTQGREYWLSNFSAELMTRNHFDILDKLTKQKQLTGILESIAKYLRDFSGVLSWGISGHPYLNNDSAREVVYKELKGRIVRRGKPAIVLNVWGGTCRDKTASVLHTAISSNLGFVAYFNASSLEAYTELCLRFAEENGLISYQSLFTGDEGSRVDSRRRNKHILYLVKDHFEKQSEWMLIIDNGNYQELRPYLPGKGGCVVIISKEAQEAIETIYVSASTKDELKKKFKNKKDVAKLLKLKLDLPYAATCIRNYINVKIKQGDFSFADYLTLHAGVVQNLFPSGTPEDDDQARLNNLNAAIFINISFASASNPVCVHILQFCCFQASSIVSIELIYDFLTKSHTYARAEVEEGVAKLVELALLQFGGENNETVAIQDQTRYCFRLYADKNALELKDTQLADQYLELLTQEFPIFADRGTIERRRQQLTVMQDLYTNLVRAGYIGEDGRYHGNPESRYKFGLFVAYLCFASHGSLGEPSKHVELLHEIITENSLIECKFERETVAQLSIMYMALGFAYFDLGDYRNSCIYFGEAYRQQKLVGASERDINIARIWLGYAYYNARHYGLARDLLIEAYEYEAKYPTVYRQNVVGILGLVEYSLGDAEASLKRQEYALLLKREASSEVFEGYEIGISLCNRAHALYGLGRFDEALAELEKVQSKYRAIGIKHSRYSQLQVRLARSMYAAACEQVKRYSETDSKLVFQEKLEFYSEGEVSKGALKLVNTCIDSLLLRQAGSLSLPFEKPLHPRLVYAYLVRADILLGLGRIGKAIADFNQALVNGRNHFGYRLPMVVRQHTSRHVVWPEIHFVFSKYERIDSDDDEACEKAKQELEVKFGLYEKALNSLRKIFGDDHHQVARIHYILGKILVYISSLTSIIDEEERALCLASAENRYQESLRVLTELCGKNEYSTDNFNFKHLTEELTKVSELTKTQDTPDYPLVVTSPVRFMESQSPTTVSSPDLPEVAMLTEYDMVMDNTAAQDGRPRSLSGTVRVERTIDARKPISGDYGLHLDEADIDAPRKEVRKSGNFTRTDIFAPAGAGKRKLVLAMIERLPANTQEVYLSASALSESIFEVAYCRDLISKTMVVPLEVLWYQVCRDLAKTNKDVAVVYDGVCDPEAIEPYLIRTSLFDANMQATRWHVFNIEHKDDRAGYTHARRDSAISRTYDDGRYTPITHVKEISYSSREHKKFTKAIVSLGLADDETDRVNVILKELNYAPLPVAQLFGFLSVSKISVVEYEARSRKCKRSLSLITREQSLLDTDVNSAWCNISLIMKWLQKEHTFAYHMLGHCVFLNPQCIPENCLKKIASGHTKTEIDEALDVLQKCQLIVPLKGGDFKIAVLTQKLWLATMPVDKKIEYVTTLLNIFHDSFFKDKNCCHGRDDLLSAAHVGSVVDYICSILYGHYSDFEPYLDKIMALIDRLCEYRQKVQGTPAEAIKLREWLVRLHEHIQVYSKSTTDNVGYFFAMLKLADALIFTNNYTSAVMYCQMALNLFENDADIPEELIYKCYERLAYAWYKKNKFTKAIFYQNHLQQLAAAKKDYEKEVRVHVALARSFYELKQYESAFEQFLEALKLNNFVAGTPLHLTPIGITKRCIDSVAVTESSAHILSHLGVVCCVLGEPEVGVMCQQKAISVFEACRSRRTHSVHDTQFAVVHCRLARNLTALRRYKQASKYVNQGLDAYRQYYPYHPRTIYLYLVKADIFLESKNVGSAIKALVMACRVTEAAYKSRSKEERRAHLARRFIFMQNDWFEDKNSPKLTLADCEVLVSLYSELLGPEHDYVRQIKLAAEARGFVENHADLSVRDIEEVKLTYEDLTLADPVLVDSGKRRLTPAGIAHVRRWRPPATPDRSSGTPSSPNSPPILLAEAPASTSLPNLKLTVVSEEGD